jgi:hypothetical protein
MSTRKDLQQPVRKSLENDVAAIPGWTTFLTNEWISDQSKF